VFILFCIAKHTLKIKNEAKKKVMHAKVKPTWQCLSFQPQSAPSILDKSYNLSIKKRLLYGSQRKGLTFPGAI
jgi:hypothetical protein